MFAADPGAGATTGQLLVQFALAVVATGFLTAIATAFFSRKKTSAEVRGSEISAAAVLTGANLTLLKRMDEDLSKMSNRQEQLEVEVAALRQQVDEGQERERGHVRQLTAYRSWIVTASKKLSDAGIQIDPPPHDMLPVFPRLPPSPRGPVD